MSQRLQARVRRDFSSTEAGTVLELLDALHLPFPPASADGTERVQAAVVLLAAGNTRRSLQAVALADQDWRDLLVAARLADEDWRDRLAAALG